MRRAAEAALHECAHELQYNELGMALTLLSGLDPPKRVSLDAPRRMGKTTTMFKTVRAIRKAAPASNLAVQCVGNRVADRFAAAIAWPCTVEGTVVYVHPWDGTPMPSLMFGHWTVHRHPHMPPQFKAATRTLLLVLNRLLHIDAATNALIAACVIRFMWLGGEGVLFVDEPYRLSATDARMVAYVTQEILECSVLTIGTPRIEGL